MHKFSINDIKMEKKTLNDVVDDGLKLFLQYFGGNVELLE